MSGDGDPRGVDERVERARRVREARDHEAQVGGLVPEVAPVWPSGRAGALDRERGSGDHVAGARPRVEETHVRAGREREAVGEDDEREGPYAGRRPAHLRDQYPGA